MAGARNAARMLSPDPKGYIHLAKIVVTIMKHLSLIALLFILSAGSGEGTMYLYGGSDAYGQGLSYPDYSSPLSLASFVTGNNTTGYYHPIQPLWDQFTFYLPFLSTQDWFSGNYDSYVPAVKDFLKEDWKPAASDHVTPTMRQFMQEDGYREGVEQHNDPDRMGLNHFLDDDEPPGRPLL
jgi:hypothetical protein